MAGDLKISALGADTTPTDDDLLVTVNDPSGTPLNKKVTVGDLKHFLMPSGLIQPFSMRTAPSGWLSCDGSAVSRSTYANLFAAIIATLGNVTITNATPAVVSNTAHGLSTGDQVFLTTTGGLPTGLTANTLYYVVRVDANSYNLATTRANAYGGTKIATSSAGSGTHTAFDCPYGLGDGSTTFTLPDFRGRVLAGLDTTGGTAASRLTNPATTAGGVYGNLGSSGGEQAHTLIITELASHNHAPGAGIYNNSDTPTTGASNGVRLNVTPNQNFPATSNTGGDVAHNTVQPVQLANYIIKT